MPPRLLAENFFSAGVGLQFSLHTIAGDEEPAGFEAWHVADGRRSASDCWKGTTANAQHTLTATCDRPRGADCVFIDRGHNFSGLPLFLETTQDNITWQIAASPIVPAVATPGPASNANGILTEEGAWWMTFPLLGGIAWRLRIPAMGSGIVPVVVGLMLGKSYQPASNFFLPWSEDADELLVQETVSEWGWRGRGPAAVLSAAAMNLRLLSDDEYDLARYTVGGHYARGRPMLICYDEPQADRAFLGIRPSGGLSIGYAQNWFPRQGIVPYIEHEPLRLS